jgi:uncharacterized protein
MNLFPFPDSNPLQSLSVSMILYRIDARQDKFTRRFFMVLNKIRCMSLVIALAVPAGMVFAEDAPSLHQVYEAAQSGHLDQAQAMMDKVLQMHPTSAKAHYVEAELMDKQGQLATARNELATAERLAPGLPFAKAQAVQELKARLDHAQSPTSAVQGVMGGGLPIGELLLGIGGLFLLIYFIRALTARQPVAAMGMPTPGSTVGPAPTTGGIGSGIVSGLATGAAVGVGMVAAEALAHRFLDGNSGASMAPLAGGNDLPADNLGGDDFGVTDDAGSWGDDGGSGMSDLGGGDWS